MTDNAIDWLRHSLGINLRATHNPVVRSERLTSNLQQASARKYCKRDLSNEFPALCSCPATGSQHPPRPELRPLQLKPQSLPCFDGYEPIHSCRKLPESF